MEFIRIEEKERGKYLLRYDVSYRTADGKTKVYEMISRDRGLKTAGDLSGQPAAAVVLILHNEDGSKILLNREFRMACGTFVYNFPAGLIENGESVEEAARRELREETGLTLDSIQDSLGESFCAVGISNEKNICLIGTASGTVRKSSSAEEEIEAAWYTRDETAALLKKAPFAARTQAYCYLWSRSV